MEVLANTRKTHLNPTSFNDNPHLLPTSMCVCMLHAPHYPGGGGGYTQPIQDGAARVVLNTSNQEPRLIVERLLTSQGQEGRGRCMVEPQRTREAMLKLRKKGLDHKEAARA